MNILPPLKVIKAWRDEGLSPTEVYRRCEEFVTYRKPKYPPTCALCGKPYFSKGLCKNHYSQQWYRNHLKDVK